MARSPLTPPCTTAAVIAALRLREIDTSPDERVAAARAARAAMSPDERRAVARRNAEMLDRAAHTLNAASLAVYGSRARLLVSEDPPLPPLRRSR
jgi:acyl-CoA reductase-like NAD-dependent aldehyde dehydrogenase